MFGKPGCSFCVKAKNALAKSGCKLIKWVNVTEKPDEKDLMLAVLANMTKRKLTTPKVFIHGNFIGGGNDCERLCQQGILKKMLEDS
jgi:glutaredoxin